MDRPHADMVAEVPEAPPAPWWQGRVLICWLTFIVLFSASSLVFYTKGPEALLRMVGCLSGSLLAAPLIVCLAERLTGFDLRTSDSAEKTRD